MPFSQKEKMRGGTVYMVKKSWSHMWQNCQNRASGQAGNVWRIALGIPGRGNVAGAAQDVVAPRTGPLAGY